MIYKDDESAVFNHYRPISILPAISKELENLVYQRRIEHLNKYNIIYTHQYDLRKKHLTYMAPKYVKPDRKDRKENTIQILLDFYTVNHHNLLHKLTS